MRIKKTLAALFSLCLAAAANAEGELTKIDLSGLDSLKVNAGTTAAGTPSAYKDRGAIYAFNGAGMSGNTHGTAANNAMFMLSANDSGSFPWYIQVDLGATKRIDAVRLYNFNFASGGNTYTERGVREFKLYVSTKETWQTSVAGIQQNYTLVLSNQLAQASGTASYTGEYFTVASPVNARFVALVALDDYDNGKSNLNYNGISEIQLFSGGDPIPEPIPSVVYVDNADVTGVETSGVWAASSHNPDRFGANYLHNNKAAAENLWVRFTPTIPTNAIYRVSLFWNGDSTRGSAVPVEVVYSGGVTTNYVDMTKKSSTWNVIGLWPFQKGSSGSVRIMTLGQEDKYVIADAVRFEIWKGCCLIVR